MSTDYSEYTILLADDSASDRKVISNVLKRLEFKNIIEAENGIEAFSFIHQQKFDLIITDLQMPKMNGLELLKTLKTSEEFGHIPIIVTSGNVDDETIKSAISLQANGFIKKPLIIDEVKSVIENIFNNKKKKINPNSQILVVDDVASARKIARRFLKQLGFLNILEANSGRTAIKQVLTNSIDLILTDWCMPEIDGNELIKMLKTKDETKNIPIIMISSFSEKERILEATESGAKGFIAKPYGVNVLRQRILDAL